MWDTIEKEKMMLVKIIDVCWDGWERIDTGGFSAKTDMTIEQLNQQIGAIKLDEEPKEYENRDIHFIQVVHSSLCVNAAECKLKQYGDDYQKKLNESIHNVAGIFFHCDKWCEKGDPDAAKYGVSGIMGNKNAICKKNFGTERCTSLVGRRIANIMKPGCVPLIDNAKER